MCGYECEAVERMCGSGGGGSGIPVELDGMIRD